MRALFDRIPPKQAPEASGGWGWSSWGLPSIEAIQSAVSIDAIQKTVAAGFDSVVAETKSVVGDLETFASSTLTQASSFAGQIEMALGLEEERNGFAKFFLDHGGPALTSDMKELAARAVDAVVSMDLSIEDEQRLKRLATAYRDQSVAFEEGDEDKEDVKAPEGVDVESIVEAVRSHNVVLLEAHQKLLRDLRECAKEENVDARDELVARIAIESKNHMQQLFSLGMFELLKRAFLLIGREGDSLSSLCPEVGTAIETGSAAAANSDAFCELPEQVERLRQLRLFLRQRLWAFQRNYGEMVRSLPDLMEDVSETEDLLDAMKQLTEATQTEIVIDTETAVDIVDQVFELLDYVVILAMSVQRQE